MIHLNYINGTIQIKYYDTNDYKIEKNADDISKLKSYKQYLKNLYNELFHDQKTQIAFSDNKYFYEKTFSDGYFINNFIEIDFKFILEIDDIF